MRVFAYCCAEFEEATRKAAGVIPLLSPPTTAALFDSRWLEGYDLLYFDLHGEPGLDYWRDGEGIPALYAFQIEQANLDGAVVFALNCYLADDDSPMMDALLDAGASYVIGGDGRNYGAAHSPRWAGLLGLWVRRLMQVGLPPLRALGLAKQRVKLKGRGERRARKGLFQVSDAEAIKDTLAFRAYVRR